MNQNLSEVVALVSDAIQRHVAHGHGEITISIKPGTVRVQSGLGYLFDIGKDGKRQERPGSNCSR